MKNMELKAIIFIFVTAICLLFVASCVHEKIEGQAAEEAGPEEGILEEPIAESELVTPEEEPEIESQPTEIREEYLAGPEMIINTLRTGFDKNNVITHQTLVYWKNTDDRPHKIACYLEGEKVFLSPQLKEGQIFSYRFIRSGDYSCRDVVFGYWGNVTIVNEATTPTGFAVFSQAISYSFNNPIEIGMLMIIIVLFTIHGVQLWGMHKRKNS